MDLGENERLLFEGAINVNISEIFMYMKNESVGVENEKSN
jgi:hypothetical protein